MKLRTGIHLAATLAAFAFTTSAMAGPGPGTWPPGYPTVVKSKTQANECCLPKEKVALACKDCKTTTEKSGKDKKGILAWFAPDSKHDCSGCGGKITVKKPGDKGVIVSQYTHVCSKCGEKSAYTCATHKS